MTTYEVSELFTSIEGEGPYTGRSTCYVRFARCNFSCPGFNGGCDTPLNKGYAQLSFNPKHYDSLASIPPITKGCDSQYAVNPEFSHMWQKYTVDELVDSLAAILPHNSWKYTNGNTTMLSLTGGEPTLRAKFIPDLLNHPGLTDCKHVLIETNCAVPLKNEFIMALNQWLFQDSDRKLIWSNSPKLSASGEKWEDAIRPDVASKQRMVIGKPHQVEQYFKFVCGPRDRDFDEVALAMEEYYTNGDVPRTVPVYIMPMACVDDQQTDISERVARMCIERGYIYCHRVHLDVFNNAIGT